MTKRKRVTWKQIETHLKNNKSFYYISYDDSYEPKRCIRCNNGWVQARKASAAWFLIEGDRIQREHDEKMLKM